MATKLYVGNLPPNTTESQILDLFKQSGNVVSCVLIKDKVTGNSKGFAFVEMGSAADAEKAIATLKAAKQKAIVIGRIEKGTGKSVLIN